MIIKASNKQHFSTIEDLAREIWTEHYTPIIGESQVCYMLDKFNSASYMENQTIDSKCLYFLISDNNEPVGYFSIEFREKELFLNKFYVKFSKRNKGFGRDAMNFIEEQAKLSGLPYITLRVNKLNTLTIQKYEKLGFRKTCSLVSDIGNGFVMDDYFMEKHIDKTCL